MAKKEREAKVSYCYDRLWEQKLSQAYHLLVPAADNRAEFAKGGDVELKEGAAYENSSDLYEGVLQSAEGG
jgi:hypothetical protein